MAPILSGGGDLGNQPKSKFLKEILSGHQGSLLVETLVVVFVLSVLGTAVAGAVQTSYVAKQVVEGEATTENIIRNQLEAVLQQPYLLPSGTAAGCAPPPPTGYYCPLSPPAGYADFSVTAQALTYTGYLESNVTTVRITVYHHGQVKKLFDALRTNR